MIRNNSVLPRAVVLLWMGFSTLVSAEPENPFQLLTAMQQAMTSLSYEGTVAILKNGKLDTSNYFHSVQNGAEQERLLSLNSPVREVIRDNDRVSCLFKATQEVIVDHKPIRQAFLLNLPTDASKLKPFYDVKTEGNEQIAMQKAILITLTPKDQYRHTRKVWVADESKLPLKIEVQDFTGTTLEQIQFTDLRVVKELNNVNVNLDTKNVHHIHQFEDLGLAKLPITIEQIPLGFEKISFTRTQLPSGKQGVDQLLLSDGLSSVSVYLDKKNQKNHSSLQTAGAVNAYSHALDDYSITIIGDVPAVTVEAIAKGIAISKNLN